MTPRQWLTLGLLALTWGSSFLFIKWGVAELTPPVVVAGRLGAGLLFLFGALRLLRLNLPRRSLWKPLLVVAVVNNVLPFTLIAWGEIHVASGLAAILNSTTPFFSVLLASTWGDESISLSKIGGLLLGFAGVVVLIGEDLRALLVASSDVAMGEIAILIAALFYAIGAVYARRHLQGEPAVQVATGQLGIAFLIMLPIALLPDIRPVAMPSPRALLAVGALGFFGSGMAYLLFYSLLKQVGATRTVIVTYLLPIVAITLGWFLLDEPLTRQMLVGAALILSGVGLVNGMRIGGGRFLPSRSARIHES